MVPILEPNSRSEGWSRGGLLDRAVEAGGRLDLGRRHAVWPGHHRAARQEGALERQAGRRRRVRALGLEGQAGVGRRVVRREEACHLQDLRPGRQLDKRVPTVPTLNVEWFSDLSSTPRSWALPSNNTIHLTFSPPRREALLARNMRQNRCEISGNHSIFSVGTFAEISQFNLRYSCFPR